jgi:endoglucanase
MWTVRIGLAAALTIGAGMAAFAQTLPIPARNAPLPAVRPAPVQARGAPRRPAQASLLSAGAALRWTPAATGSAVPASLWRAYRQRFIQPDGRLVDTDNGGVSHSEGQGYAMLLAVLAGDPEAFRTIWTWTALNLFVREDNLAAWRWRPGDMPHVKDKNNATDGDLLIAWALARAGRQWNDRDYSAAARRIALAIARLIDRSDPQRPLLPPAAFGFGRGQMADGPVVNLSYLVLPAFSELRAVAPEVDWDGLRRGSARMIARARFGPAGLPPDWLSLASGAPAPARFQAADLGYEGIRIPLYVAWSEPEDRDVLPAFAAFWRGRNGDDPGVIDLATGSVRQPFGDPGYRGVVALTKCAVSGEPFPPSLRQVDMSRYFPPTLHMLALAAAHERYPQCLTAAASR